MAENHFWNDIREVPAELKLTMILEKPARSLGVDDQNFIDVFMHRLYILIATQSYAC
jgi:hypothetical protein